MTDTADDDHWITAADIANYVVCPEAWRLKYVGAKQSRENPRSAESQEIRREWVEKQELSSRLSRYAKVAYTLLVLLTIVVFLFERYRPEFLAPIIYRMKGSEASSHESPNRNPQALTDSFSVPEEILSLLLVLGLIIYMWDLFERRSARTKQASGLEASTETVAVKGSSALPPRQYRSESLRLLSKPDALIREGQALIPVDIHPLAKKVRDRHVVQLLAHLRLVEEEEKLRPEYGVLLLGREQRRVQIKNSPDKQRWLETLIDEMHSIMSGVPAVPAPSRYKCKSCDVRAVCTYSAYTDDKREDEEESP